MSLLETNTKVALNKFSKCIKIKVKIKKIIFKEEKTLN